VGEYIGLFMRYGPTALVMVVLLMMERFRGEQKIMQNDRQSLQKALEVDKEAFEDKLKELKADIDDVKGSITWSDTCEAKHKEIDRRLDRVEHAANGTLRRNK